jgi:ferredoxin
MTTRVDLTLLPELKKYGAVNLESCFNCGNCTAICPLSEDGYTFPRNMIREVQLGLRHKIKSSPDPWLCYYCGECSDTCPRQAEPAETMMSLRRWLTAQYDWTGLGRLFYTSARWEIGSIFLVAAFVVALFAIFHGPVVTDRVELNTFAPVDVIHIGDWIMAGILMFFLLTNAYRMYQAICCSPDSARIPLSAFIQQIFDLPYHFAIQQRFSKCAERGTWVKHLALVSGYVTMLVLILFFLGWFQTDNLYPIWHPQRWIGYLATIGLLYGAGSLLWGRFHKTLQIHRFSHASDWIFPILLILGALTGILIHAFRYLGWPLPVYAMYVIHLAIMVPMLVLEVPFGKWAHLAYRPLAIYFVNVKRAAVAAQQVSSGPTPNEANIII